MNTYCMRMIIFNISPKIFARRQANGRKVLNAVVAVVVDDETCPKYKLCFCFEKFASIIGAGVVSWINDEARMPSISLSLSPALLVLMFLSRAHLHVISVRNFCLPFYSFRMLSHAENRTHSAAY